jgi:uncharacterized protein involved in exopolysaccharide biosynthesis
MPDTNLPGAPADLDRPTQTQAPAPAEDSWPSNRPGYGGYGYGGTPAHGGYGQAGAEQEVHLLDYLRTVYRHRWVTITAFALIVVSTTLYTFLVTPIYEGRVQLQIEPENPNIVSFKEVVELDKATNEYYQTQYSILKSRALARRTIETLRLWNNEELSDEAAGGGARWWRSGSEPSAAPAGPGETAQQSATIDVFLKHLSVAPIRNSRLVDVRFRSASPTLAASVANTIARQYIQQNLEFKFLSTKEASDWLSQQLTEQRKKVEESELALQRYREKGDAVALEDRQNIVVQRLSDLNAAVTKARTERIEKEALFR